MKNYPKSKVEKYVQSQKFLKPLYKLYKNLYYTLFELGNRPIQGLCLGRFPNCINCIRFGGVIYEK